MSERTSHRRRGRRRRQRHHQHAHQTLALIGDRARCHLCGCTDDDCRHCIERTGSPCRWVRPDLCSACAGADEIVTSLREVLTDHLGRASLRNAHVVGEIQEALEDILESYRGEGEEDA